MAMSVEPSKGLVDVTGVPLNELRGASDALLAQASRRVVDDVVHMSLETQDQDCLPEFRGTEATR
jgi:FXSXX-COOH protein